MVRGDYDGHLLAFLLLNWGHMPLLTRNQLCLDLLTGAGLLRPFFSASAARRAETPRSREERLAGGR